VTHARQRRPLRVLHLATHDGRGGAARATRRLHAGLRALGVDSRVLVRERYSREPGIVAFDDAAPPARRRERARRLAEEAARADARRPHEAFSSDRTALGADLLAAIPPADLYNLHWVGGFVDWAEVLLPLSRRAPLVWTLSDLNALTGGCHYDLGCGRYREACGACPQLASRDPDDASRATLRRKCEVLARMRPGALHVVAASRWLADRARESAVTRTLPTTVIPRGVDVDVFRPRDRDAVRRALGIGRGERVALLVSTRLGTPRKGLAQALEAARHARDVPGFRLVCVGLGPGPPNDGSLPVTSLGHVASDDRLAELMSAADVLIAPSLQEAFGLTVLEAMACGTPVVAFDTGGAPDLVKPGRHGYVVPVGDARALGHALRIVLRDDLSRGRMGEACRALAVEGHGLDHQARRYRDLYRSLGAAGPTG
jgi:glycosyltransferase involved in cell wall biosynthesis